MNDYRRFLSALWLTATSLAMFAQSGTNSPYSQYGLGVMAEQGQGFNRAMNGLSYGLRQHNQVNSQNPASYSSVDSLTFIFDAGLSLQNTNLEENGTKINAKNSNFEYAVAAFRVAKSLGLSFGILPYTNIGYDYYVSRYVGNSSSTYYTNTFSGSGGVHQGYLGFGWGFIKNVSIGANFSYLWGNYSKSLINSYSDSYVNTLGKYYTATINSYKVDLGAQFMIPVGKKYSLTAGLVYGLGHKIGDVAKCEVISKNSSTSVSDTASYPKDGGGLSLSIPTSYGIGLAFSKADKWSVGIDYSLQKWGSEKFPDYQVVNNVSSYVLSDGLLKDRHKIIVGGEYVPNDLSRDFFSRIHYRFGAYYATPYIKVNGLDGPKEYSLSAGFGIPIINKYNNSSLLNLSGQWVHSSAKNLITENYFRINIGITFNERWFMKWKVE
jgi:hypothetical protein